MSTGYKAPSAKALHNGIINFSGQATPPVLGNPDLKPETSINDELG
ncbi:TonB-dependent receptor [Acinetobacter sp. ANC 4173]|nr:TonB-dependent receptor [Acinetobacter sp. ANC 4173]TCB79927.1 TonB-dependent receptor [Acinetobacter sp. ANC 4173]